MTKQIETATVIGSCTGNGTAIVTVTAARIATNPTAVTVNLTTSENTAALVADKCRTALALNATVSDVFQVSGSGADIVLTSRVDAANDTTLNIAIANGSCTGLTAAPTSTDTLAGSGLSNCYITLAQIKANGALGITDTTNDVELEDCINATSRGIDNFCNQFFYQTASQARYFTPTYFNQCLITPLVSASAIAIDNDLDRTYSVTLVSGTDYDLYPYNAALLNEPYWRIDRYRNSAYQFMHGEPKFVRVTGVFGWPAVPQDVQHACLLWSMRLWERHKTILGVSAMGPLGSMRIMVPEAPDPDVAELLANYHLEITGVI